MRGSFIHLSSVVKTKMRPKNCPKNAKILS